MNHAVAVVVAACTVARRTRLGPAHVGGSGHRRFSIQQPIQAPRDSTLRDARRTERWRGCLEVANPIARRMPARGSKQSRTRPATHCSDSPLPEIVKPCAGIERLGQV